MPKPLVLISTGKTMLPSRGDDAQSTKIGCDEDYVSAVLRAGGVPCLLPPHGDKDATRALVGACDALLLTGGGDIHSLCYGQQPHPKSHEQDPARDATELMAVDFALRRRLPILGISRGAQVLNVARGGTLLQHIPGDGPGAVKHNSQGLPGLLLHSIEIQSGSLLHSIFETQTMAVNSFHHQAPDKIGDGLRASAWASDGIVEAIEGSDGSKTLGVLFHPEECAPFYPQFNGVFGWLIKTAKQK